MPSSISTSHGRRQPISLSAAAAAASALLILSPIPSAHSALLRGGDSSTHQSTQQAQDLLLDVSDYRDRKLLPIESEEDEFESSMQEDRALANNDEVRAMRINTFETKLLAKNFPYHMKFNQDDQISSAVTSYLADYLEEKDEEIENLVLNCARSEEHFDFVLSCSGMATFKRGQLEANDAFNEITRQAFEGNQRHMFLGIMYPQYEMIHEKKEWDNEKLLRRRGGTIKRKKKGGKKKKGSGMKGGKKKKQVGKKGGGNKATSGGGSLSKPENGENVLGYQTGMKQMNSADYGYTIKNGNIHVQINDGNR